VDIYVITWSQDGTDEESHPISRERMGHVSAMAYLIESSTIDLQDIQEECGYARIDRIALHFSARSGDTVHHDALAVLAWDAVGNPYWRNLK